MGETKEICGIGEVSYCQKFDRAGATVIGVSNSHITPTVSLFRLLSVASTQHSGPVVIKQLVAKGQRVALTQHRVNDNRLQLQMVIECIQACGTRTTIRVG